MYSKYYFLGVARVGSRGTGYHFFRRVFLLLFNKKKTSIKKYEIYYTKIVVFRISELAAICAIYEEHKLSETILLDYIFCSSTYKYEQCLIGMQTHMREKTYVTVQFKINVAMKNVSHPDRCVFLYFKFKENPKNFVNWKYFTWRNFFTKTYSGILNRQSRRSA